MPISIPWHASGNWQPTEVTQFINHVNSGAGTLIVGTDAGLAYLKALGNPDGPHALVKDLLGTHLAAMLGLPTFDYAVIEITELDELPFFKGGNAEPGPAFVTRGEEGSVWGNDKRLLGKIDNPDAISGLVVVDTWLRNTDRHYLPKGRVNWDNVFFSKESSEEGKLSLRAMDFSHAIQYGGELTNGVSSITNITDDEVYGMFPEFRKKLSRDAIRHFASVLGGVSRSQIEDADTRGNQIQLTEPAFVKVRECQETIDQLFEQLVGGKAKSHKRESFTKSLQTRFVAGKVADLIETNVPISVPILDRETRVPFAFQNGAFHLLQPVTFTADKEESNFNRALKYSMEGKILQEHPDDEYGPLKFNVIGRFASMSDPSIPIVRKVLAESNVRLHLDHDLSGLVDEIRRTGRQRTKRA